MPRPIHFDIHASDPQRAANFYTQLFGWQFQEYIPGTYWSVVTGEQGTIGINGGMALRRGSAPDKGAAVNAFVCTLDVENIDATIAAVEQAGGEIAMPKHAIPNVGWLFYFIDTEGNLVGAMQEDSNAA